MSSDDADDLDDYYFSDSPPRKTNLSVETRLPPPRPRQRLPDADDIRFVQGRIHAARSDSPHRNAGNYPARGHAPRPGGRIEARPDGRPSYDGQRPRRTTGPLDRPPANRGRPNGSGMAPMARGRGDFHSSMNRPLQHMRRICIPCRQNQRPCDGGTPPCAACAERKLLCRFEPFRPSGPAVAQAQVITPLNMSNPEDSLDHPPKKTHSGGFGSIASDSPTLGTQQNELLRLPDTQTMQSGSPSAARAAAVETRHATSPLPKTSSALPQNTKEKDLPPLPPPEALTPVESQFPVSVTGAVPEAASTVDPRDHDTLADQSVDTSKDALSNRIQHTFSQLSFEPSHPVQADDVSAADHLAMATEISVQSRSTHADRATVGSSKPEDLRTDTAISQQRDEGVVLPQISLDSLQPTTFRLDGHISINGESWGDGILEQLMSIKKHQSQYMSSPPMGPRNTDEVPLPKLPVVPSGQTNTLLAQTNAARGPSSVAGATIPIASESRAQETSPVLELSNNSAQALRNESAKQSVDASGQANNQVTPGRTDPTTASGKMSQANQAGHSTTDGTKPPVTSSSHVCLSSNERSSPKKGGTAERKATHLPAAAIQLPPPRADAPDPTERVDSAVPTFKEMRTKLRSPLKVDTDAASSWEAMLAEQPWVSPVDIETDLSSEGSPVATTALPTRISSKTKPVVTALRPLPPPPLKDSAQIGQDDPQIQKAVGATSEHIALGAPGNDPSSGKYNAYKPSHAESPRSRTDADASAASANLAKLRMKQLKIARKRTAGTRSKSVESGKTTRSSSTRASSTAPRSSPGTTESEHRGRSRTSDLLEHEHGSARTLSLTSNSDQNSPHPALPISDLTQFEEGKLIVKNHEYSTPSMTTSSPSTKTSSPHTGVASLSTGVSQASAMSGESEIMSTEIIMPRKQEKLIQSPLAAHPGGSTFSHRPGSPDGVGAVLPHALRIGSPLHNTPDMEMEDPVKVMNENGMTLTMAAAQDKALPAIRAEDSNELRKPPILDSERVTGSVQLATDSEAQSTDMTKSKTSAGVSPSESMPTGPSLPATVHDARPRESTDRSEPSTAHKQGIVAATVTQTKSATGVRKPQSTAPHSTSIDGTDKKESKEVNQISADTASTTSRTTASTGRRKRDPSPAPILSIFPSTTPRGRPRSGSNKLEEAKPKIPKRKPLPLAPTTETAIATSELTTTTTKELMTLLTLPPTPTHLIHSGIESPQLDQPKFTLADVGLMNYYTFATARTLGAVNNDTYNTIWQEEVPLLAQKHIFLMHAMLGIAAAHQENMNRGAAAEAPRRLAIEHFIRALSTFQSAALKVSADNASAIFCFCTLITFLTFTVELDAGSPAVPVDSFVGNLCILKSAAGMLEHNLREAIARSPVGGLLDYDASKTSSATSAIKAPNAPLPDAGAAEAIDLMEALIAKIPPSESADYSAYLDAIMKLRHLFVLVTPHPDSWARLIQWPMRLSPAFFDLLRKRRIPALVILAHWLVPIYHAPKRWFIGTWPKRMLRTIVKQVDDVEWVKALQWPMRELQLM